ENAHGRTGETFRARFRISGVPMASGAQPKSKVKNSRIQAWCMPAARMVKTVWVASNSPTPNQIVVIQTQREDDSRLMVLPSMSKIVFHFASEIPIMQPITLTVQATE